MIRHDKPICSPLTYVITKVKQPTKTHAEPERDPAQSPETSQGCVEWILPLDNRSMKGAAMLKIMGEGRGGVLLVGMCVYVLLIEEG